MSKYPYYYISSLRPIWSDDFFTTRHFKNALDALNALKEYARQNIECELFFVDIAHVSIAKYINGSIVYNPFAFEIVS